MHDKKKGTVTMKPFTFALLAATLAGCHSTPAPKPDSYRPGTEVVKHESGEAQLTASQLARALRVRVELTGASEDSVPDRKLAEVLRPHVRNALCKAGFEVVFAGDAEIAVMGTAKCHGGSARGIFAACRGSVELNFLRGDTRNPITGKELRRVVGTRRFDAKSKEARSDDEALASLGDAFAAPISTWMQDVGAKMAADLAICEITVRSGNGRASIGRDYPTLFVTKTLAIKGVHDCRIDTAESSRNVLKARIVYEPRQVPEGVLNRLMSIKDLKITR